MAGERLDSVLRSPRLPTLPAVAVKVLELTKQPQTDLKQIAEVIQNDQALATRVIRTVNSSYFGRTRPCADIKQAIVYLGLNAVKMLSLGFSLATMLDADDEWQVNFDYMDYWRRNLHAAAAAREIARVTRSWDAEESFLAALLQDLGMIAFHRAYGDIYLQAIDLTDGDHSNLPSIEDRALQSDHARLGAALTERWNLPEQIVESIRHHHDADSAPEKYRPLTRIVQLSAGAAALTVTRCSDKLFPTVLERFKANGRTWFDLNDAQLQSLLKSMAAATTELADLFKVDVGGPADVDEMLCEAEDEQLRQHMALEAETRRSGAMPQRLQNIL